MQNETQYDLDRKVAKITALSSNNWDKYEYLTGEDLGLKPSTIEQTKFEYSPLSKIFNKGLSKNDKKEGLFKRLENIKDKNYEQGKKQLNAIKNISNKNLKAISYLNQISPEAKELYERIKKEKNDIDPEKFVCVKTDGTIFNFNNFKVSLDLASDIYNDKELLKNAEANQQKIKELLDGLDDSDPKKHNKKNKRKKRNSKSCNKIV